MQASLLHFIKILVHLFNLIARQLKDYELYLIVR